ncbi:MAG: peptidoglycan editing factor PgeF [Lawsonibacter sp.]|nr:peptidoglycan editing factor PgeF [Lawsonibacter sp.]
MEIVKREIERVQFYACTDPAWAGARHGFSTRLGGVSPAPWNSLNLGAKLGDDPANVRENFARFCAAVGTDASALVKNHQVHGNQVRSVTRADVMDRPEASGTYEADGLVTDQPGVCLTIFSGDCIPILLYDPVRRCIAASHAGWRGTAAGIAARAVEAMVRDYGCQGGNILAAIGPGIGPCCFETHADVPDGLRSGLGPDAEPFIRPLSKEGKFSVDLKEANARLLERAGLRRDHIAICTACTACDLNTFWSHRVQGSQRGSMAAMIQLV